MLRVHAFHLCEVVLVFFYHRSLNCCIFLSFCTALLKELVLLLICHGCGGGGNCFHVFLRELQTAAGAVNECSTNGWRRKCCAHLSEFHATLRQLALHNRAAILVTGTHHPRQYAQSSCGSLARTPGNERYVQTSSLKDCEIIQDITLACFLMPSVQTT